MMSASSAGVVQAMRSSIPGPDLKGDGLDTEVDGSIKEVEEQMSRDP